MQDGARNLAVNPQIAAKVHGTRRVIEEGRCTAAPLIMVEAGNNEIVVLEGHSRATAYAILSDRSFPAFIGTSSLMDQWAFI